MVNDICRNPASVGKFKNSTGGRTETMTQSCQHSSRGRKGHAEVQFTLCLNSSFGSLTLTIVTACLSLPLPTLTSTSSSKHVFILEFEDLFYVELLFFPLIWLCEQILVPTTWVILGPHTHTDMQTHIHTNAIFIGTLHWLPFIVNNLTKTLYIHLTMTNLCLQTLTSSSYH